MLLSFLRRKLDEYLAGVDHVTLDPEGPGAVHVHVVPPVPSLFPRKTAVFLNGTTVLLLSAAEARLLRVFFDELRNRIKPGAELDEETTGLILDAVAARMHYVYPRIERERFKRDLGHIVNTMVAVAHGAPPPHGAEPEMSIRDYAPYMRAPHRMDLVVSPMKADGKWFCEDHCKVCYAAGAPFMDVAQADLLTTSQWKQVIDILWKAGVVQLTFTGGEPTKRKNLAELVAYAQRFVTRLNTNGIELGKNPELAQQLREASLDGMQITLYSAEHHVHNAQVKNPQAWNLTTAGIRNAIAAGLNVSVNVPLVRANAFSFPDTLRFVHGLGIRYVSCSGLIPTGAAPATIEQGDALSREELFGVVKQAVAVCDELDMELSFTSPGQLSDDQLVSLGLTIPICGAALTNMAISPSGEVMPCQSWLHESIGNILKKPWKKIWNAPRTREIRFSETNGCPLPAEVKK